VDDLVYPSSEEFLDTEEEEEASRKAKLDGPLTKDILFFLKELQDKPRDYNI